MVGNGAGGPIRLFRRRCEGHLPPGSGGGGPVGEPVPARSSGNGGMGQAGRRDHERLPVPAFAGDRRGSTVLPPAGHAAAPDRSRPPARHIGCQRGDLSHHHRFPPAGGDVGTPKKARNSRPQPSASAPRAAGVLGLRLPRGGSNAGRPIGRDDHHRGPPVAPAGRPRPRDRLDRDASPHARSKADGTRFPLLPPVLRRDVFPHRELRRSAGGGRRGLANAGGLVGEGGGGGLDGRVPRDAAGIRRLFPGGPFRRDLVERPVRADPRDGGSRRGGRRGGRGGVRDRFARPGGPRRRERTDGRTVAAGSPVRVRRGMLPRSSVRDRMAGPFHGDGRGAGRSCSFAATGGRGLRPSSPPRSFSAGSMPPMSRFPGTIFPSRH